MFGIIPGTLCLKKFVKWMLQMQDFTQNQQVKTSPGGVHFIGWVHSK